MIMPRGDTLLLPANPLFVWLTLVLAFVFNLVPLGRMPAMPDFLAVVLVFWNVHQTRRIGVGVAFLFGLAMDVHDGAVLGQHALAYTLLGFFATTACILFGDDVQVAIYLMHGERVSLGTSILEHKVGN